MTFLDELLLEVEKKEEERRIEMSKIRCDQILQTIAVLESKIEEVNQIAEKERAIISEWENSETGKLNRQIDWLARQMESFIRSSDQKSIVLAHGSLHLRLGKPKVQVIDLQRFLPVGEKMGLIRVSAPSKEPDLNAIHAYIRSVGSPPPGVAYTPATTNFSFKTKGTKDDNE